MPRPLKSNLMRKKMPTRKEGVKPRGQWNPERLKEAIKRIQQGGITFREAERHYGVPVRTIKRRMENGNTGAPGRGPQSTLGPKNEEKLVKYINRLCNVGFCPGQATVRRLAYEFAVALKLDHKFNKEKKIAGYDWLWAFFRRHPELSILSIKKAQGLSMSRRKGLTKEAAEHFYDLLGEEITKHTLQDKPQNIFTVDETGLQLINKEHIEVNEADSDTNGILTGARKGDPISLVVCCSAEGKFLPPTLIFKVKSLKPEFSEGLPPGSNVYMNPKSAYINSEIFLSWFTQHFLPQKPPGQNILILNGHCSRVSSIALLELADENKVSLLCLPPHATHALQPLGKSFFAPFKTFFKNACTSWIDRNVGSKLTQHQVGSLICEAWNKSATYGNGSTGFRITGIYPLNRCALPDCSFSASENTSDCLDNEIEKQSSFPPLHFLCAGPSTVSLNEDQNYSSPFKHLLDPSHNQEFFNEHKLGELEEGVNSNDVLGPSYEKTRFQLEDNILEKLQKCKKARSNEIAIKKRRLNSETSRDFDNSSGEDEYISRINSNKDEDENKKTQKVKVKLRKSSCSDLSGDKTKVSEAPNSCKVCSENYFTTKNKCDWLRCLTCCMWLHEDCTYLKTLCPECGEKKNRIL